MKSWFVSDIHLKNIEERNSQILLRFLYDITQDAKNNQLFLLGDIFDFWVADGDAFYQHYKLIVDAITYFKESGGLVYYFEGNHDFHIDTFWTKKFQIPVYADTFMFNIDHLKVRIEHGDFINPDDTKYLEYRSTIRQSSVKTLAHILPSFFVKWLGDFLSSKSRKKSKDYAIKNQLEIKNMIRKYARHCFSNEKFDLIITGHMHVQDDHIFKDLQMRSINLGTWLNQPIALKIENGKIEWKDLSVQTKN